MIRSLWALLLALIWATATREFSVVNFVFGLVLGYLILLYTRPKRDKTLSVARVVQLFLRLPHAARFAAFYIWELILANVRVARDVLTPRHRMKPGIIAVPLDARTNAEITLLANLLTLTPGSLCIDVSHDQKTMYVHVMNIEEGAEDARRKIKEQLERRVLELLR